MNSFIHLPVAEKCLKQKTDDLCRHSSVCPFQRDGELEVPQPRSSFF
jgi:hypothetical protein